MSTLLEIGKLKPVKVLAPFYGESAMAVPDLIVGVELELENFNPERERDFYGFTFTEDGSLRNNGIEAITAPVHTKYLRTMLTSFFNKFEITDRNYSERTSTHVHVNVQNSTPEQIATLALVYQTAERLLFRFIGNDRVNSIFCVPWYQSGMSYQVIHKMTSNTWGTFRDWQKYSALNFIPATTQGTVEFRHLHGTCDVELICKWVNILAKMMKYAHDTPFEVAKDAIVNMNTVSNYREWLYLVFGEFADFLSSDSEPELARGVIDSKLMLMKNESLMFQSWDWDRRIDGADDIHVVAPAGQAVVNQAARFVVADEAVTAERQALDAELARTRATIDAILNRPLADNAPVQRAQTQGNWAQFRGTPPAPAPQARVVPRPNPAPRRGGRI